MRNHSDIPDRRATVYITTGYPALTLCVIYIMFTALAAPAAAKDSKCDYPLPTIAVVYSQTSKIEPLRDGSAAYHDRDVLKRPSTATWEAAMIEQCVAILKHHAETSGPSGRAIQTPDLVLTVLGSPPDLLGILYRTQQRDPLILGRLFAGIEHLHRFPGLYVTDRIPEPERDRLMYAVKVLACGLADWVANRYGDNPTEADVYELTELAQFMARGAFIGACSSQTPMSFDWARKPFQDDPVFPEILTSFRSLSTEQQGRCSSINLSSRHQPERRGRTEITAPDRSVKRGQA